MEECSIEVIRSSVMRPFDEAVSLQLQPKPPAAKSKPRRKKAGLLSKFTKQSTLLRNYGEAASSHSLRKENRSSLTSRTNVEISLTLHWYNVLT